MDLTDEKILDILRADARASFSDIGRRVGLSTNAASARVRRLERNGVILGYRVILSAEEQEPGAHLEAFIDVRLKPDSDSDDFLTWTRTVPQVHDAVHVTGGYDYLLRARIRDMAALDQLLRRLKKEGRAAQTQTRLALRQ